MRFQQLKRSSNVILKKKLYKSGTSWVVKSTLGLMSGLALFGVSQSTVVKADSVNNMSPVSQSISKPDSMIQSQADTESGDSSVDSSGSEIKAEPDGQASLTDEKDTSGQSSSEDGSPIVGQSSTQPDDQDKTKAMIPTGPVDTGNGDIPNNQDVPSISNDDSQESNSSDDAAALDQEREKESDGSDMHTDNSLGVPWSINGDVLNIEGGTLNNITDDNMGNSSVPWSDSEKKAITKVSINGDIIAGEHFSGMFDGFSAMTEIDGLEKINTKNTIDMSFLFSDCSSLTSLNLNNLDVSNVEDFSNMFNGDDNLNTLDISNWKWSDGVDFFGMFAGDQRLETLSLPLNYINSTNVQDKSKLNFNSMFSDTFSDSPKFASLDISNLDMYGTQRISNFLRGNRNMNEITLSGRNVLYIVGNDGTHVVNDLGVDGPAIGNTKPVAWQAISSNDDNVPVGTIKTSKQLVKMYSGNLDKNSLVTWKWVYEVAPIKFQVEYVAEDDPTKLFSPGITYQEDPYREYDMIPPLSSYTLPEGVSFDGYYTGYQPEIIPTPADANGIIKIKVPKNLITFEVIEKNTDGVIIGGKPHDILVGVGSRYKETNLADELKKISNDRKIITSDDKIVPCSNILYKPFGEDSISEDISDSLINGMSVGDSNSLLFYGRAFITELANELLPQQPEYIDFMSGYKYVTTLIYKPEPGDAPVIQNNGGSSEANRTVEGIEGTLGTYNDRPEVQLYDDEGSQLTDRKLAISSDWFTDETMTLNNDKYYRVATNQWAKADDVYIYYNHDSNVLVNTGSVADLVTADGKNVTDRALQANSGWYTDRYIYINNSKYYRVATNEFVSADKVREY